jgi:L,D-peptidoglycan transpeptidase YkuD (ErfK/YbiS/YcfS/YnhG family)
MIIKLKNKDTLICDDFEFKCSIGKNGLKRNKSEGDKCTPIGTFSLGPVYYRSDRITKPDTELKTIKIHKRMGWCDDPNNTYYNRKIRLNKKNKGEKFYRKDKIYDVVLVINYNTKKIVKNKGSAIFMHVTNNYRPTKGCISLSLNDLQILLKIIKKKSKIRIF